MCVKGVKEESAKRDWCCAADVAVLLGVLVSCCG